MTIFEAANRLVGGLLPDSLTAKSAQSKFLYSSELNRSIVERRIADLTAHTGKNKSQIVEETLVESLLPLGDSTAAQYVNRVLLGKVYVQSFTSRKLEPERYGIREALIDIFRDNCSGTRDAIHDNLEPLVVLAREILPRSGSYFATDAEQVRFREFVCGKMHSWLDMVYLAEERDPLPRKLDLDNVSVSGTDYYLFRLGYDDPQILPFNYLLRVLDKWELCKGWSSTYEFLAGFIEALTPWEDSALDRIAFQESCCEVMGAWDGVDLEDGSSEAAALTLNPDPRLAPKAPLVAIYDMADGGKAEVPLHYAVVNWLEASSSTNLITVSVAQEFRQAYGMNVQFAFFSSKPRSELSPDELRVIKQRIADFWPDFAIVVQDEDEHGDARIWVFDSKENEGLSGSACIVHRHPGKEGHR